MPDDENPEQRKFRRAVEGAVIELARQHRELTVDQLWERILQMKRPEIDRSPFLIHAILEHMVQKLIEEGRVKGHFESRGRLRSGRFVFDVDVNICPFREAQAKVAQNIKLTVLDLGTKFTRLQVAEIAESCGVADEALIITTVQDMIAKRQVDAQYFASTKAVAFNQQANLAARDAFIAELEAEFASWGKKGQAGKTG